MESMRLSVTLLGAFAVCASVSFARPARADEPLANEAITPQDPTMVFVHVVGASAHGGSVGLHLAF